NIDYAGTGSASSKRLNREQTAGGSGDDASREIVWSGGETLDADAVVRAFKLPPEQRAAMQRDASPTSFQAGTLAKVFFAVFIVVLLLLMFRCGDGGGAADCSGLRNTYGEASTEYRNCLASQRGGRTGGGSFGGFSSGGGHK
ncbi:MAG TPA: DUF4178 domain-containing protein, partial [Albitalea sp.]|nr:DUF4178 domain-containing protein [Albitalea sp.]